MRWFCVGVVWVVLGEILGLILFGVGVWVYFLGWVYEINGFMGFYVNWNFVSIVSLFF